MNKEKLTYLSPETETLVVRFEGVICTSAVMNVINLAGLQNATMMEAADNGFSDWDD